MIPYFDANVKAAFPSPAMDYLEKRIDPTKLYVQHPMATFIVKCSGDSMLYAIPEEAELLVDRSITPGSGDIVVAAREDEFTVKFLRKDRYKGWLVPANNKYPSFPINEEVIIWGKVIRILVNPETVSSFMPLVDFNNFYCSCERVFKLVMNTSTEFQTFWMIMNLANAILTLYFKLSYPFGR